MVKVAEKKRKKNPLLPVLGIILALSFGLFAYLLVPPVAGFMRSKGVALPADVTTQYLLIGGLMWFLMFGIAMFLVSILVGRSYDENLRIEHQKESARRREVMKEERELRRQRRREANREKK